MSLMFVQLETVLENYMINFNLQALSICKIPSQNSLTKFPYGIPLQISLQNFLAAIPYKFPYKILM